MKVTRTPGGNPYANAARRGQTVDATDTELSADAVSGVSDVSMRMAPEDQVQILGIPSEEFTPRVQAAIGQLMQEVEDLRRDLTNANKRLRELEDLADMDTLLPIPNRRAFVRELNRMIRFAERYGTPSTLMFVDMNDLKKINDQYGHEAGDRALFHLARTLRDNLRGTDMVGRLGGDEFGILLSQADSGVGTEKAQKLADAVANTPLSLGDENVAVRFAYGIYTFGGSDDAEAAITKADEAMYEHKRAMKGEDNVR